MNAEFARLYNQGLMLERAGQTVEAVAVFRQALAIRSGDIDAWIHLGLILRDLGQDEEANRAFLAALDAQRRDKTLPLARGKSLRLDFAP